MHEAELEPAARPGRGTIVRLPPGARGLPGWAYVPELAPARGPVLVAVHGISRNAREQVETFRPTAMRLGWPLVAPEFGEVDFPDYQRLGRVGRGPRADLALDDLLATLAERFRLEPQRLALFGYSAGGQFVHRYAMAHPERVRAAVVAAPGWFTLPDPRRSYPQGLRVGAELPGVRLAPVEFLKVPMLVAVGSRDVERDESLRRTPGIDRRQGHTRVERAARFVEAMTTAARQAGVPGRIGLRSLEGAGHGFPDGVAAGVVEMAEAFLADPTPHD